MTKAKEHIFTHWLPVKILLLVYKALHDLAPDYLSEMFLEPGRPLRPSSSSLLAVHKAEQK